MKKTVPFELFGANQYLEFDMVGLAALERSMGISIPSLMASQDIGVDFILRALPIAMRKHYFNKPVDFWAGMVQEYLDAGGSLEEIAIPLVRAIAISGVMGSAVRDRVVSQMESLPGNGEEQKNELRTATTPSKPSKNGSSGLKK